MNYSPLTFQGRKILVTGANRGIGREVTRQLVQKGADVLAVARDETQLAALKAEAPDRIDYLASDLSAPEMPHAVANWVEAEHPDCTGLINNAAIMVHTLLTDAPCDRMPEIRNEVNTNLVAPIALCAEMLPILSRHPSALIANVTSGLAISPLPNAAVYCATKAGLRSFTKTLRYQCEDAGLPIQVSEVLMTLVDTALSQGDPEDKMPVDQAAREMLDGLSRKQGEIFIGPVKYLQFAARLSPALADQIIRTRVA